MGQLRAIVAKLIMSRIRAFWVISALRLCCIYALLSRIRFCRQYALILVCFVQTFTQTLRILLKFFADICPKNWSLRPLIKTPIQAWGHYCDCKWGRSCQLLEIPSASYLWSNWWTGQIMVKFKKSENQPDLIRCLTWASWKGKMG